jgi:predicted permease
VLPYARYPKDEDRTAFFARFLSEVEADPHVVAAGASETLPLGSGDRYWTMLVRPGWENMDPGRIPDIAWFQVTPDYFRAMAAPLRAGRAFTPEDDMNHPLVTIVSENLANKFFAGEDPLGKQIRFGTSASDRWLTIVGVVSSTPVDSLADELPPAAYTPYLQGYNGVSGDMTVVVRSDNTQAAIDLVRNKLHQADPSVAIASSTTLEQVVADSVRTPRTLGRLFTAFAMVAVLLSAVGLFGVLSYAVSQRQREIGIRMALGASRIAVMRMVISESGVLVASGCVLGTIGAIAGASAARSLLFGVKPTDPTPLLLGSLAVALVSVFAAALPARRAMQVDPMQALRDQ